MGNTKNSWSSEAWIYEVTLLTCPHVYLSRKQGEMEHIQQQDWQVGNGRG